MKRKQKIFGVICVVSIVALIATTIVIAGPKDGYPDEPIGFDSGGGGPENGYPDEPIGGLARGGGPENGYPDEPIGGFAAG